MYKVFINVTLRTTGCEEKEKERERWFAIILIGPCAHAFDASTGARID